jgi:hypothetical protein
MPGRSLRWLYKENQRLHQVLLGLLGRRALQPCVVYVPQAPRRVYRSGLMQRA